MADRVTWGWAVPLGHLTRDRGVEEALELATAAGITAVEGNVGSFAGRESDLDSLAAAFHDAGVAVTTFHLPFNAATDIAAFYETDRRAAVDTLAAAMEMAAILGCRIGIQHPTVNRASVDMEGIDPFLRQLGRSLDALLPRAQALNFTIALENMLPGEHRFGSKPDHFVRMAEAFDDPHVGFCLDTGHALVSMGPGRAAEIPAAMGDRLVAFHLADNAGDRDSHLAPGRGLVDWAAVFRHAGDLGFDGTMCIETPPFAHGPGYSPDAWRQLITDTHTLAATALAG